MTQLLPPKKEVALALLERSNVDVYLDPRAQGVVVPPQFRKEPRLILKIGLNMPVPIPDLRLDDESMSCTLSFNRSPFYCVVPWSSVFAMVGEDGRGMVWPDDVPHELAVHVVDDAGRPTPAEGAPVRAVESPRERGDLRPAAGRARGRSKLAETGPEPERKGAGSKKAGKKKKDENRPVLVAVPPPAPSSPVPIDKTGDKADKAEKLAAEKLDADKVEKTEKADKAAAKADKREKQGELEPVQARLPISVPTPVPVPAPSPQRGETTSRPKRELPPYLRVVK
ncbi:Stringent starvation protein B [Labilithrix luteola]|uniref:Stringent starvation protein B n=1 Tax=Labilithrix luteola TaxID=1391654 RepID=A0A0K1PY93_9BACT|nr:hypothetical protein [Labilithrix luteola]AKU98500.1 Stringent starvation protein B [Labilithrix luteola]